MDVSDRRMQVQLTQEAKIASDFSLFRAIFAFAGFVILTEMFIVYLLYLFIRVCLTGQFPLR